MRDPLAPTGISGHFQLMETGNCWLLLDTHKSTVPKQNVTPAEALYLTLQFEKVVNGKPITELTVTGKSERTGIQEVQRLKDLYNRELVAEAFPGASPSLPQTFAEIAELLGWTPPPPAPKAAASVAAKA